MRTTTIITMVSVMLLLTACSSKSIKIGEELEKSYQYDGKTIELHGKISTSLAFIHGSTVSMGLRVYNDYGIIETGSTNITGITFNYGEGKNSIIINTPEGESHFQDKDVVIYDKDGNKLTTSDKIKITGLVTYTSKGPKEKSPAEKMVPTMDFGKDKEKEGDGNNYSYSITNVVIEKD